jgi:hypothetical protein
MRGIFLQSGEISRTVVFGDVNAEFSQPAILRIRNQILDILARIVIGHGKELHIL